MVTCTCDCADGYSGETCRSEFIAGHFVFLCTIGTCVRNVYYLVLRFCKIQTMQNQILSEPIHYTNSEVTYAILHSDSVSVEYLPIVSLSVAISVGYVHKLYRMFCILTFIPDLIHKLRPSRVLSACLFSLYNIIRIWFTALPATAFC